MKARPVRSAWGAAFATAALAVSSALPATDASAGSNLPEAGYPAPSCGERPQVPDRLRPPERPEQVENDEARAEYNAKVTAYNAKAGAYNVEVDAYNASMKRFVECLSEYVTNAAADVRLIRRLSREAADRASR